MTNWAAAIAKAKFSELLEKAQTEGPQAITRRGRSVAVVVSAEDWERQRQRKGTLAEFFAQSPLRGSRLAVRRLPAGVRDPDL
jgi:prevent-host-death family protein